MRREVREETGLEVASDGLAGIDSVSNTRGQAIRIVYWARVIGGALRAEELGTTDDVRFFPRSETAQLPLVGLVEAALRWISDHRWPEVPEAMRRFCDDAGRLVAWPAEQHRHAREVILDWLLENFTEQREYTEAEVDAALDAAHTFGDAAHLRRLMVQSGRLSSDPSGRLYWRPTKRIVPE